MAIAVVTSTAGGQSSGYAAYHEFYHNNTETGTNHCLIVGVTTANATSDVISGVTYAGETMDRAVTKYQSNGNKLNVYLYYKMNPASGNNLVRINQSPSSNEYLLGDAVLYSGVHATPINATGTNGSSSATSLAVSVTSTTNNCWLVGRFGGGNPGVVVSTGTTLRQPATYIGIGDSNGPLSTGANSLNGTSNSAAIMVGCAVALAPAEVANTSNFFQILN